MGKIVVTGAAGFIGSHLAEALLERGHDVVGIDCFTDHYARPVKEANLTALLERPAFRFEELDLRDAGLDEAVAGAAAVFHLAALPGLRNWDSFGYYLGCNLLATQRLLDAARRVGVGHFLHASTSSVYGRLAQCDENGPRAPCSAYGVSKVGAEELCLSYERTFDLPMTILRFFSVYGPRQRPDMAYNIFIRSLLAGEPITIHGDGEQSRSNTYVDDLVRGALLALERPDASVGQTFNLGGGEVVTVNEALAVLEELTGGDVAVVHSEPRAGDQRHTEADFSKAERLLGYRPTTSLRDGLAAQVAWQRAALSP